MTCGNWATLVKCLDMLCLPDLLSGNMFAATQAMRPAENNAFQLQLSETQLLADQLITLQQPEKMQVYHNASVRPASAQQANAQGEEIKHMKE